MNFFSRRTIDIVQVQHNCFGILKCMIKWSVIKARLEVGEDVINRMLADWLYYTISGDIVDAILETFSSPLLSSAFVLFSSWLFAFAEIFSINNGTFISKWIGVRGMTSTRNIHIPGSIFANLPIHNKLLTLNFDKSCLSVAENIGIDDVWIFEETSLNADVTMKCSPLSDLWSDHSKPEELSRTAIHVLGIQYSINKSKSHLLWFTLMEAVTSIFLSWIWRSNGIPNK